MTERSTVEEAGPQASGSPGLAPYLHVALDAAAPGRAPRRFSLADVETVTVGRGRASGPSRADEQLAIWLEDQRVSTEHARLERGPDRRWLVRDLGSLNGVRLNGRPVTRASLGDGDVLEVGRTFLVFRGAQRAGMGDLEAGDDTPSLQPELEARFTQLEALASSGVPVVVEGEPGVGKELVARLAHQHSRRPGALVSVNCGALPPELVTSQFFGSLKGAFSGATEDRPGLARAAHQGTLFLDEVGELPLSAQPVLLRMLQERQVVPVGGTHPVPVDVLLVCATNRDLTRMVREQRFRPDLLARLSGFSFSLPPLRERREDLGLMVRTLLRRLGRPELTLSPETARALFASPWPMNVRELERALQVAVALTRGDVIEAAQLPATVLAPAVGSAEPEDAALRRELLGHLEAHRGNLSAVARALGRPRMQVHRLVARLGLDPEQFRGDARGSRPH
jgi:DNA-binding NtrC family response regulator